MSKNRVVLLTIVGCVLGLLFGFFLFLVVPFLVLLSQDLPPESWAPLIVLIYGGLGFLLVGAPAGAAMGATITQKLLKRRSSFWRAILGAVGGFAVGVVLNLPVSFALYDLAGLHLDDLGKIVVFAVTICSSTTAGAVIGSGWKAKPRDATSPSA